MTRRSRGRGTDRGPKLQPSQAAAARVGQWLDELEAAEIRQDAGAPDEMLSRLEKHSQQAADELESRIAGGSAGTPEQAFDLLERFAGERFERRLRRIAEHPTAPDAFRLRARKLLGWPAGDDEAPARLAFLATLADRDTALVTAAGHAAAANGAGLGMLDDLYHHLDVLSPVERAALVRRLAHEAQPVPVLLLNALLHDPDADVREAAVEGVARSSSSLALGALERLALTATDPATRERAQATADQVARQAVSAGWSQMLPLRQAYVSNITIEGEHWVNVIREVTPRQLELLTIQLDWSRGITHVVGMDRGSSAAVDDVLLMLSAASSFSVEVGLPVVRGVIADALERNARAGQPLPPAYEIWEPLLHETWPPLEDEPLVIPELDSRGYTGRADLVEAGGELHQHEFFWSWSFDPRQTWDVASQIASRDAADWGDEQYAQLVARIVDAELLRELRSRLERQAWLLDLTGEHEARDMALAVAASFGRLDLVMAPSHPFLLAMASFSVATAYIDPSTQVDMDALSLLFNDPELWEDGAEP